MLLRKIRRANWFREDFPWVPEDEAPADSLYDLATTGGKLSVWVVEDGRANLPRILAALAGNRDALANIDYVLFDEAVVGRLGLRAERCPGESPDEEANSRWHRDLIELTASGLAKLAKDLYVGGERNRLLHKAVTALLVGAVESGWIPRDGLRREVVEKLWPEGPPQ